MKWVYTPVIALRILSDRIHYSSYACELTTDRAMRSRHAKELTTSKFHSNNEEENIADVMLLESMMHVPYA